MKLRLLALLLLAITSSAAGEQSDCEMVSRQSYLAHVAAASSALQLNQTSEAKRWLAGAPENFRGWEWEFLRAESDRSFATLELGSEPRSVEYHPNEPIVAIGMDDHSIRLVRTDPLEETGRIDLHENVVYRAVFSPDGTRLASTARDFTLRLTDLATKTELWSVSTPAQGISSVAFHPDGSRLVLVTWHRPADKVIGLVLVYDAATGEELSRLEFGEKPIVAVEFSPDGSKLAVGTWGWRVAVWEFPELGEPQILDLDDVPVYAAIDDIGFSPDGSVIAAASKDKTIRAWSLASGERIVETVGHSQPVSAVEFAPSGRMIATASWDGTIRLLRATSGTPLATLHGHDRRINDLTCSPDGTTIITVSSDGTVRSWHPADSLPFADPRGRHEHVYAFPLSSDGSLLATGAPDGAIGIWSTRTGELLRTIEVTDDLVNSAGFSPDGAHIATCTWETPVVVADVATGKRIFNLEGQSSGATDCGFSPDGSFIYASSSRGGLHLWSAATGELLDRVDHEGSVAMTVWHPKRPRVATITGAGVVTMWDLDTRAPVWRQETDTRGMALAISDDGSTVASAGADGTIRLWGAEDGTAIREMQGHSAGIWSLSFHPNGERLASGSSDQSVRIWDTRTGEMVLFLPEWSQSVYNVDFSPDGSRLYVNSSGAEIRVLEARTPLESRVEGPKSKVE